MKVETPIRDGNRVAQAKLVFGRIHIPWTDQELERLRCLATTTVTSAMIADQFRGRSERAVKSRLSEVRAEMGVGRERRGNPTNKGKALLTMLHRNDPGLDDGEYRRRCRDSGRGSAMLLERMIQAATA